MPRIAPYGKPPPPRVNAVGRSYSRGAKKGAIWYTLYRAVSLSVSLNSPTLAVRKRSSIASELKTRKTRPPVYDQNNYRHLSW